MCLGGRDCLATPGGPSSGFAAELQSSDWRSQFPQLSPHGASKVTKSIKCISTTNQRCLLSLIAKKSQFVCLLCTMVSPQIICQECSLARSFVLIYVNLIPELYQRKCCHLNQVIQAATRCNIYKTVLTMRTRHYS